MKISLVSACLFTALFVASTSAQIVSKKALEQDLAYTVKTVAEVHPALVNEGIKRADKTSNFCLWRKHEA